MFRTLLVLFAVFLASTAALEHHRRHPGANNNGLPDHLMSGMENLSGLSTDHVKVHYNSGKPASMSAHVNLDLTTSGTHLPRELAHVIEAAKIDRPQQGANHASGSHSHKKTTKK